jgi:Ycf66 protein N-terminus
MLASLSGSLALAVGLAVMLLPLLSPELSRPRDAAWGAVVLLLGLTLVTSADRLTGAPMLAVLCGGLLIGRLGSEVMQLRWRQLTPEEQQGLTSSERWQRSGRELATSLGALSAGLVRSSGAVAASLASLTAALRGSGQARPGAGSKRWVRPEPPASQPVAGEAPTPTPSDAVVVTSFAEIDALIEAAGAEGEAG